MVRRLLMVAFALVLVTMMGSAPSYWDTGYGGSGGYVGSKMGQDVNLSTLGQDLIAGEYWTPVVEFDPLTATKYYFDPDAAAGGTGTIDDPFQSLGVELYADNVIERWNHAGTLTNAANSPVVGAGDVCVLREGNHGKIQIDEMRFTDYVGVVGMPGEAALFDYVSIRVGSFWYFENLEANPANTRNSGYWPTDVEHIAFDYADYDDRPWFVKIERDTIANNFRSSDIVFNNCKIGVSSGDLPAAWDHEEWNSTTVGGFKILRTPRLHIQGCYGVGLSQCFNVSNYYVASGGYPDSTATTNYTNIFNNRFQYMNGDGIYLHHTQYAEVKGNDWSDTYCSNDDHVVMIDCYDEVANHIFASNRITISSERRPKIMAGYEADCAGGVGSCEGHGGGGIHLIGGNTNNVVKNNVIHGNDYKMIEVRSLYGSSYNVQVVNNTVTCDTTQSWESSASTANIGTEICTIGDFPGFPVGDTLQVTIANNICSGVLIDLPEDIWSTDNNNSEYGVDFTGAGFTSWIPEQNPMDQVTTLTPLSENIDDGWPVLSLSDDFNGDCRPKNHKWDVGAYEHDDDGGCLGNNILADSWDFPEHDGEDCWSTSSTLGVLSVTNDVKGPYNDNAVRIESSGNASFWNFLSTSSYSDESVELYTCSITLKAESMPSGSEVWLRLQNTTDTIRHQSRIAWNPDGSPYFGASTNVTSENIVSLGGGWYHVWMHVDLAASEVGDLFNVQVFPFGTSSTIGNSLLVNGVQLELGNVLPGPYLEVSCQYIPTAFTSFSITDIEEAE